jgi:hypothetical protein
MAKYRFARRYRVSDRPRRHFDGFDWDDDDIDFEILVGGFDDKQPGGASDSLWRHQ